MTAAIIPFPVRSGAKVIPITEARAEQFNAITKRAAETLRLTGIAARDGNTMARDLLAAFSRLKGEPAIAASAKRMLDAFEVQPPSDTEGGAA